MLRTDEGRRRKNTCYCTAIGGPDNGSSSTGGRATITRSAHEVWRVRSSTGVFSSARSLEEDWERDPSPLRAPVTPCRVSPGVAGSPVRRNAAWSDPGDPSLLSCLAVGLGGREPPPHFTHGNRLLWAGLPRSGSNRGRKTDREANNGKKILSRHQPPQCNGVRIRLVTSAHKIISGLTSRSLF